MDTLPNNTSTKSLTDYFNISISKEDMNSKSKLSSLFEEINQLIEENITDTTSRSYLKQHMRLCIHELKRPIELINTNDIVSWTGALLYSLNYIDIDTDVKNVIQTKLITVIKIADNISEGISETVFTYKNGKVTVNRTMQID